MIGIPFIQIILDLLFNTKPERVIRIYGMDDIT